MLQKFLFHESLDFEKDWVCSYFKVKKKSWQNDSFDDRPSFNSNFVIYGITSLFSLYILISAMEICFDIYKAPKTSH